VLSWPPFDATQVVLTRVALCRIPRPKVIHTMEFVLAAAAPTGGGFPGQLIILLLFIVIFYFLIIRPQQVRARQQRQLVTSLAAGDRIVTIGGLHGTVQSVDEDTIRLEVAPDTVVTFSKVAIARRLVDLDDEDDADLDRTSGE
jgi:preprotein translocase subunit YajC